MEKVLKVTVNFDKFLAPWGAWCEPIAHENYYYIPLGWEEELEKRNIEFEEIEINLQENNT